MKNNLEKIFTKNNLTTAGFLATIFAGVAWLPDIPAPVLGAAVGAYGTGMAFATAFFRFRGLMKDGTPTKNKPEDGALAGLGIIASMAAVYSGTYLKESMTRGFTDMSIEFASSEFCAAALGFVAVTGGFLQTRAITRPPKAKVGIRPEAEVKGHEDKDKPNRVFNEANITAAGFLIVIFGGVALLPKMPESMLGAVVGAYGTGMAFATAFFRSRMLLKDGTDKESELGDGTLAGLGVVASMAAIYARTYLKDAMVKGLGNNEAFALTLGLAAVAGGFFQTRAITKPAREISIP